MRNNLGPHEKKAPSPPDLSKPSLRSWLQKLPVGSAHAASFETRIWWSPGGATKTIDREFARTGYRPAAKRERFVVTGTYGPLREGELDRARAWGARLARAVQ
jgi:hypothetical protein